MSDFFLQSEMSLFTYRLSCMSVTELKAMVKSLRRLYHHICTTINENEISFRTFSNLTNVEVNKKEGLISKEINGSNNRNGKAMSHSESILSKEMQEVKEIIDDVTNTYTWDELVDGYVNAEDDKYITISFRHVNGLVAKRLVTIHRGYALVPCRKLSEILKRVFELTLR